MHLTIDASAERRRDPPPAGESDRSRVRGRLRALRSCGLVVLGVAALAGCASTLSNQVTTFHSGFGDYAGKRFEIRPDDGQRDSLEFDAFASSLRAALARVGMVPAPRGEPAELAVTMRYSVTPSQARASGGGGTIGIGSGGGFSMGGLGVGVGISVPIGGSGRAAVVGYRREVQVQIDRLGPQGSRVFEGRVVSEGPDASLAPVLPAMLQALFEDFPGASGTTRVVEVPVARDARE